MQQAIWFGKYHILRLLGTGGNCEVYLAEHIKLKAFRAIKFISKNHPFYDLQCKEALILKNLKHSCIPIIYDIEENEDGSYIVEQYIEGITLRECLNTEGPLKDDQIIEFGLQLCNLIGYLHADSRPLLYVDLKPENIILSGNQLKLIDFGSAIYLDEPGWHPYFATRGYAAPELYHNEGIDETCDVYGIGMLMYYMATGEDIQNRSGTNHIDYIGKCSKKLKKVISNCLKFHPSQRFSSVTGLSKELSVMKRRGCKAAESSRALRIAIAGAQPRIGVTHLAFRLCEYYLGQGINCVYQEKNTSGCVEAIHDCYENVEVMGGIHIIHKIPMLPYEQLAISGSWSSCNLIMDYGQLTKDNLPDYLSADVRLLILGAKDWEVQRSEQAIQMTTEYKDIIFLLNFSDASLFQSVLSSMGNRNCLRIPYESNPFSKVASRQEQDFYRRLTAKDARRRFYRKRKVTKGENINDT